ARALRRATAPDQKPRPAPSVVSLGPGLDHGLCYNRLFDLVKITCGGWRTKRQHPPRRPVFSSLDQPRTSTKYISPDRGAPRYVLGSENSCRSVLDGRLFRNYIPIM